MLNTIIYNIFPLPGELLPLFNSRVGPFVFSRDVYPNTSQKTDLYTFIGMYISVSVHIPGIFNKYRLYFCVRVYCNRSKMTSQRVKNKKYDTRRSRVAPLFFTRCDVFCDLLQYTHTHTEQCSLFVLYNKNPKIY